ncbi:ethylene-insensitive protein 2.2-like [Bidens hawaiensis]|uniref:ethylene-insensitive protein 2.2-like n=1 Tax=Bidens hawaiensis TaxID=980011 RepID=UPI00404BA068
MESEALIAKPVSNMSQRLFPAFVPVLFVAIGYVDPGKWVAAVEGGARFGYDLTLLMFVFSLAAVLCQYLSACITVVTGRDLAQICSSEYYTVTCIFLGIQAELSMIALDLSMILGIAHALHLMFGMSLFTCVLLTSLDVFLFPLFSGLLETGKAKFMCVYLASFTLVCYLFSVLMGQPDTSLSVGGGMLITFSGESVFALISLLGASMMPHNFYLHSSFVLQMQGSEPVSKGSVCVDHLFAISSVFSGIFMVNYVVMNSAANVFYSSGLDLLTFQDALSLMDQAFRNLIGPFALLLILLLSSHTTALTWKFSGKPILHSFFKLNIPGWYHHSTIRFVSVIPALLCSWHSGAEGTYQLLIFTQIVTALLLPSSVIPLFRIATSRSVMGANKVSSFVEFMVLITFVGMLGLSIIFVIEMVFGSSDWASNIRWSSSYYTVLLLAACVSFFMILWLAVTPLKSASFGSDYVEEPLSEYDRVDESVESYSVPPSLNLVEEVMEPDKGLATIEENASETIVSSPPEELPVKVSAGEDLKKEEPESIERTLSIDGNSQVVKEKEQEQKIINNTLQPEELVKVVPETNHVVRPDGPPSFKSLGLKHDDVGSGTGSWSKLAGLGRAARRQLAAVLDEFWGQLFDFHGEPTQEAKARKLDKLLGIESKVNMNSNPNLKPKALKVDNKSLFDSSRPQSVQARSPSSLLSTQMQLLDAYAQRSNLNVMDPSEKRYHSLRLQSSSGGLRIPQVSSGYDDQPATVHGYQIKSYMNQLDPLAPKSPSFGSTNYKAPYSLTKGLQNGTSPAKPPGFPDPVVSRNSSMQPERSYYNHPAETHSTVNEKKYYSMPDISGLSLPHRDGSLGRKMNMYTGPMYGPGTPSGYVSPYQLSSGSDTWSIWSRQPFEQFGVAEKTNSRLSINTQDTGSAVDLEANLLKSLRLCIVKLLKLEGSDWLFQQNSGLDEDLVDRVAARERFLYEVESEEVNGAAHVGDPGMKIDLVTSIPNCGEGCVWRADLVTSFGVWCIHRVLELSLMESRPELWGKYTYVLNRLQGIIELAFSKPRAAMNPCFCLQLPSSYQQQRASPPKTAASLLPPMAKQSKGKCTTAGSLLDIVKDVEIAISCRKGRTGTAAGDVAFPKGKENLASVLKRYKRRLSSKVTEGVNANKPVAYGV